MRGYRGAMVRCGVERWGESYLGLKLSRVNTRRSRRDSPESISRESTSGISARVWREVGSGLAMGDANTLLLRARRRAAKVV